MNRSEKIIAEISNLTIRSETTTYFKTKKQAQIIADKNNKFEDPKDPDRFVYVVKEVKRPSGSKLGNFFVEIQEPDGHVIGKL